MRNTDQMSAKQKESFADQLEKLTGERPFSVSCFGYAHGWSVTFKEELSALRVVNCYAGAPCRAMKLSTGNWHVRYALKGFDQ